ncbi:MAG: SulP family inorganic anion transporter [Nannocystis sp.]|uniref:SulP family inorganic anion transporter n=1 Tax=Nannocystis sp. TaxID=1962667 RepID=UPI0024270F17|nr:SulP family inorganic anion transporter [Nannocystis sp.]MBK9755544.1 SulP family inorganic anion transporter [Nannocystis sp.]
MNNLKVPKDGLAGFTENLRADLISGFLVFLIALPLCIGISMASGFPPVAGLFTAIIGGVIVSFFSGAPITIKGPAAGLIPIAAGCIEALRADPTVSNPYLAALAVVTVAGVLQILFGLVRAGKLTDFFPTAAVHGMLAAIGILIISKEIHAALGVTSAAKSAIGRIADIPHSFTHMNPQIALIGGISLLILIVMPRIKHQLARKVPAPLIVLAVAIPLGLFFELEHTHSYMMFGSEHKIVSTEQLITLPANIGDAIAFPDFSHILTSASIQYIILFALIGSIESLASAKAIDTLDPYKRKSNFNKDLLAVGIGNTAAGLVGGLPMISEIVRSSANVNNGGKTRWANFWHGIFLLGVLALVPGVLHYIPRAALGAMLVFTGFRLASPKEFAHMLHVGKEQLFIFLVTIVVTVVEDLLFGIIAGIVTKMIIHLVRGAPISALFKPAIVAHDEGDHVRLEVQKAAIFSNYLGIKSRIFAVDPGKGIVVDLSGARLVDHSVMQYLRELTTDFAAAGRSFKVIGLEHHVPYSHDPTAARRLPT